MPEADAQDTGNRSGSKMKEVISKESLQGTANCTPNAPPRMMGTNWIDGIDPAYVQLCLHSLDISDYFHAEQYLREIPSGIGIITGSAGCGKTFLLGSAALLMHEREGKVLASAVSTSSVSQLAQQMNKTEREAVNPLDYENYHELLDDPTQTRRSRKLIVCASRPDLEAEAFLRMLASADQVQGDLSNVVLQLDIIAGNTKWDQASDWILSSSTTEVLLTAWGWFHTVQMNDENDHKVLLELRDWLDQQDQPKWKNLRAVLRGEMSWKDYEAKDDNNNDKVSLNDIISQFRVIWNNADILCTTSALSESVPEFQTWKREQARAIAIDDVSSMTMPDLLTVWGHSLKPLLVAGNPEHLPPTAAATTSLVDEKDDLLDRFGKQGGILGHVHLMAQGIPVFRLKKQMRMARGIFDIAAKILCEDSTVPKDNEVAYSSACDIRCRRFDVGRSLERFLVNHENMTASPDGMLTPAFIHCPNARVVDAQTGSKRSPDQVRIALDFILDFLEFLEDNGYKDLFKDDPYYFDDYGAEYGDHDTVEHVMPNLTIITPYAANVDEIKIQFQEDKYKQLGLRMGQPVTVDKFQGRENDIIFVVMGTRAVDPGPEFTVDPQYLSTMLTRSRCGLVIFGDINVVGHLKGNNPGMKLSFGAAKYAVLENGQRQVKKDRAALYKFHKRLFKAGRVAERS